MTVTVLPTPALAAPSIDDGRVEVFTLDEALVLNPVTEHVW
jgi:hypothetical protein